MSKYVLPATTHHTNLRDAKRIYLGADIEIDTRCPKCNAVSTYDKGVPILCASRPERWYCHVVVCDECGYESTEKMYSVEEVGETTVTLKFNDTFDIKVFGKVRTELDGERTL